MGHDAGPLTLPAFATVVQRPRNMWGLLPALSLICCVTLGTLCPLPQFPHLTHNIFKSIIHDNEARKNAALILFSSLLIGHGDCNLSVTLDYVCMQHSMSCKHLLMVLGKSP